MEMSLVNERRAARHAVPVECQVVREDDFTMLGGEGVDLSTCGMLLRSDAPAAVGEDVVVSLRIPGSEQWIDARGKVARVVYGRRFSDAGRALAISFEFAQEEQRRALEAALCAYPLVPASREPRVDYAGTASMIGSL